MKCVIVRQWPAGIPSSTRAPCKARPQRQVIYRASGSLPESIRFQIGRAGGAGVPLVGVYPIGDKLAS